VAGLGTTAWADEGAELRNGELWQWAFSIPMAANPMIDATGQNCSVGQNGKTWYLPGTFGGGNAARSCTIPEGVQLVVKVAGSVFVNTPGACGDEVVSVPDMRAAIARFVDGLTHVSATLNGAPVRSLRRVRSKVYATALPADNVFGLLCPAPGIPAGVYARTVDDGYVAEIEHLRVGTHTLRAAARNSGSFSTDVVYTITVVPRDGR
jgi:hypothetical protein